MGPVTPSASQLVELVAPTWMSGRQPDLRRTAREGRLRRVVPKKVMARCWPAGATWPGSLHICRRSTCSLTTSARQLPAAAAGAADHARRSSPGTGGASRAGTRSHRPWSGTGTRPGTEERAPRPWGWPGRSRGQASTRWSTPRWWSARRRAAVVGSPVAAPGTSAPPAGAEVTELDVAAPTGRSTSASSRSTTVVIDRVAGGGRRPSPSTARSTSRNPARNATRSAPAEIPLRSAIEPPPTPSSVGPHPPRYAGCRCATNRCNVTPATRCATGVLR